MLPFLLKEPQGYFRFPHWRVLTREDILQRDQLLDPRLLAERLVAEPTANIDPANQQGIVSLIKEACGESNIGLILVTHAMEVASQFDRIDHLENINLVAAEATASMSEVEGEGHES